LCEAISAHFATAIPNAFGLMEKFETEPWREAVVGKPFDVSRGVMRLADRPGIGVDFNEEAALARPYESRDLATFHVRNYTGKEN
jgi:L-alanine-DL-glutamate epimerase-like enolase superfamily enzyme